MNDVFDFIQKNGSFNKYKNGYILFSVTHDLCSFMTLKFSPEKDLFFTSENDEKSMTAKDKEKQVKIVVEISRNMFYPKG